MLFQLSPLDLLNLLFIPLMAITVVEARGSWRSLWDDRLTPRDRYLLQRIVIFLLLPAVVFLHELGHVAAIKLFGGSVAEFHWAFLWGFVRPEGLFSPEELVWSYLAGSLVQIAVGILSLIAAGFVTKPPVVALLVYLMFWSIGGTLILYALMSVSGLYGDWIAIYTAPCPTLVLGIAVVHTLMVILLLWGLYGSGPRIWYLSRICPEWYVEMKRLSELAKTKPSVESWLALGWCFYNQELFGRARRYLLAAQAADPLSPDVLLFEGALHYRRGDIEGASVCFQQLLSRSGLTPRLRARTLIALGGCRIKQGEPTRAQTAYQQAIESDPLLADGRFYQALLLRQMGMEKEAEAELMKLAQADESSIDWIDAELKEMVYRQLSQIQGERPGSNNSI